MLPGVLHARLHTLFLTVNMASEDSLAVAQSKLPNSGVDHVEPGHMKHCKLFGHCNY